MRKALVGFVSFGLVLGLGVGVQGAIAQDSGVANTAEDFKSADSSDGILGSNVDIWDVFHRASSLSDTGITDEGFHRSQSRRINREAEALRARQRAIIEQQENQAVTETAE